jgi:MFS family permease
VITTHDYTQFPNGAETEESLLSTPPSRDYLYPQKPSFLSRRLFVTLVNYAFLAFLDASLYATFPLLLASPIASGGLNFTPKTIGYILGTAALCHALIQALCFSRIIKRWDAKNVYVASIVAYVFLYLTMPILNALAHQAGHVTPAVWGLLCIDVLACFSSYSAYSQWNE